MRRRPVHWRLTAYMAPPYAALTLVGVYVLTHVPTDALTLALGVVFFVFAVWRIAQEALDAAPCRRLRLRHRQQRGCGRGAEVRHGDGDDGDDRGDDRNHDHHGDAVELLALGAARSMPARSERDAADAASARGRRTSATAECSDTDDVDLADLPPRTDRGGATPPYAPSPPPSASASASVSELDAAPGNGADADADAAPAKTAAPQSAAACTAPTRWARALLVADTICLVRRADVARTVIEPHSRLSGRVRVGAVVAGAAAGLARGMLGIGGPPLMVFYALIDASKGVVRGTTNAVGIAALPFLAVYLLYVEHAWDTDHAFEYIAAAGGATVGLLVGNYIHHRVQTRHVMQLILLLLLSASLSMMRLPRPMTLAVATLLLVSYALYWPARRLVGWLRRRRKQSYATLDA